MSNLPAPPPSGSADFWEFLQLAGSAATLATALGLVASGRSARRLRAFAALASAATTIYAHTAAPPRCPVCGTRETQTPNGTFHCPKGFH